MIEHFPGALLFFIIYFIPTLIANYRRHIQRVPIGFFNLFFGWTIIGWFCAFVWAVSHQETNKKEC